MSATRRMMGGGSISRSVDTHGDPVPPEAFQPHAHFRLPAIRVATSPMEKSRIDIDLI